MKHFNTYEFDESQIPSLKTHKRENNKPDVLTGEHV
jgi:hypothetical protein